MRLVARRGVVSTTTLVATAPARGLETLLSFDGRSVPSAGSQRTTAPCRIVQTEVRAALFGFQSMHEDIPTHMRVLIGNKSVLHSVRRGVLKASALELEPQRVDGVFCAAGSQAVFRHIFPKDRAVIFLFPRSRCL